MSRVATLLALGLLAGAAGASELHYLADDEVLCDRSGELCLRGTLTYAVNSRVLYLRGRVQSAPGPGMLQIIVKGSNRQGFVYTAPMEIDLRGNRTEIIDFHMIPDHPDVSNWEIERIDFRPKTPGLVK